MCSLRLTDFSRSEVGLLVQLVVGFMVLLICLEVLLLTRQFVQLFEHFLVLAESTPVLVHFWRKCALLLLFLFKIDFGDFDKSLFGLVICEAVQ